MVWSKAWTEGGESVNGWRRFLQWLQFLFFFFAWAPIAAMQIWHNWDGTATWYGNLGILSVVLVSIAIVYVTAGNLQRTDQ